VAYVRLGKTTCKLCGDPFLDEQTVFGTSESFFNEGHPLQSYCDQTMHLHCYRDWEARAEFAA
ncbi:unnamed protein product, partial [Phaeothamnion confervicola]